jgi:hypothetical protein
MLLKAHPINLSLAQYELGVCEFLWMVKEESLAKFWCFSPRANGFSLHFSRYNDYQKLNEE